MGIKTTITTTIKVAARGAGYVLGATGRVGDYIDQSENPYIRDFADKTVADNYKSGKELAHEHVDIAATKIGEVIDDVMPLFEDDEPITKYKGYGSFGKK